MGQDSKIEWTHHTFNPWRGCSKVSPGCDHCYAERGSKRNPKLLGVWGDDGTRVIAAEAYWKQPIKWDAAARAAGVQGGRHRVFCASLADVFEDRPELVAPRARLLDLIRLTPSLDWLLLTKRPENIQRLWFEACKKWGLPDDLAMPMKNVWLGTSVENQAAADARIPHLLKCPAAVRFLSCEPLLGPVDIQPWIGYGKMEPGLSEHLISQFGPDWLKGSMNEKIGNAQYDARRNLWVICGGESGPGARPMHPDWARGLLDQCQAEGVPFFFKQWGNWAPKGNFHGISEWNRAHAFALVEPDGSCVIHGEDEPDEELGLRACDLDGNNGAAAMAMVGKHAAGRLLDGREWSEFPLVKDDRHELVV